MSGTRMVLVLEMVVPCGGRHHVIRWTPTGLELPGHPGDRDADDVLAALSGTPARCVAIERAWNALDDEKAIELLDRSSDELDAIARRLAPSIDQRNRVQRRDDFDDEQRRRAIAAFDQVAYLAEVAALGPALAHQRARDAAAALCRPGPGRPRRGAHDLVASAVARRLGASRHTITVLPWSRLGAVGRIHGRAIGVVSPGWLARHP